MRSDSALITDFVAGDKTAFRKLVDRHKQQAYVWALGLVGNKDDAFDISQEAFIRVYRSLKRFDLSKPFGPWFYTIVSNLSKSWLRRRKVNEYRLVDIDDVSYLLAAEGDPDKVLAQKTLVAQLRKGLMQLSFNDREIIVLQHIRGMSYDEIATLLEIPRGTVMSRLYYARKRLARLMRQTNG